MSYRPLHDIITQCVSECGYGTTLTRTKLIKLVYLTDALSVSRRGRQITSVRYGKYAYGPYSDSIVEATTELDDDTIIIVPITSDKGHGYDHDPYRPVKSPDSLSDEDCEIVDDVLAKFGDADTREITEYVCSLDEVEETEKYGTILGPRKQIAPSELQSFGGWEGQD